MNDGVQHVSAEGGKGRQAGSFERRSSPMKFSTTGLRARSMHETMMMTNDRNTCKISFVLTERCQLMSNNVNCLSVQQAPAADRRDTAGACLWIPGCRQTRHSRTDAQCFILMFGHPADDKLSLERLDICLLLLVAFFCMPVENQGYSFCNLQPPLSSRRPPSASPRYLTARLPGTTLRQQCN